MNTLEIKKEESMEASNIRYYHFLSCTFWSTDGEIAK